MTTLTRTLQNNWLIYIALLLTLLALLALSPAEATLGNVVKIVYAHGAAQRIATYAYLIAGGLGVIALSLRAAKRRGNLQSTSGIASSQRTLLAMTFENWTQAVTETAIVFWFAHILISVPAQVLAWGALTLDEPRVASALWILAFTALVYIVARWIGEASWLSMAAIVNTVILFIVLRGAVNILHPIDPIIASDSLTIKGFYAAIVVTMGLLAFQLARNRAKA
jgi:hypothetical protein